jgi:phthalate 4,5-cis-dihydrodiol dehydrogenase
VASPPTIRLGVIGLGTAGSAILPSVVKNPHFTLAAAADLDQETLGRLKSDFPDAQMFGSAEALTASPNVDAVFIATPTQYHTGHVVAALEAGKHVVTEKPIAISLDDADKMIAAAERADVVLMVGHSFSYETPIREIRNIVTSGELGPLKMIHNWYFTDWIYRPRNPEELDTTLGGGVTFRQGSHQFDLIRMIGGGMVRSVRAVTGRWDPARPAEGAHTVFMEFEDGAAATAVYSGYDRMFTAEITFGVGEGGQDMDLTHYGAARRALAETDAEGEAAAKRRMRYGAGRNRFGANPAPNMPFYGLTLVSCELGDIRQSPDGLIVYGPDERREVTLIKGDTGRDAILRELYAAVVAGVAPIHDGRWGKANLEVCLAVLESSRERKEIYLSHQKAVND